jgi:hypothetical protein
MRLLLALLGLVVLLVVARALGGEWLAAYPGISGGVAALASSPLLVAAGLALSVIGVVLVNLFDPESDAHLGGGMILAAVVGMFVVVELIF